MNKSFKINIGAFIISLALGILFVYINTPKPKIIFKYPTPDNANNITYKDPANNCYKYTAKKVECNDNYKEQPVSL